MAKPEITCVFFSDLLPWERKGVEPVVECLSHMFEVKSIDVTTRTRTMLRGKKARGPIWIFSSRWEEALHSLKLPSGTRTFVSVLAPPAPTTLFPALFWRKLRTFSSSVHLIAHSPLSFRFLCEIGGLPQDQVRYLPVPIASGASRSPHPVVADVVSVGALARFTSESNLNYFLNVAHYVTQKRQNVHFKVLGAGPLRRHLTEMVQDLGLKSSVSVVEASENVLGDLNVLLYLPLQNSHFIPLMLAGACKVPIVASELPGIENFIQDGRNGFIVPVNDTKPMAELVLRLADDLIFRRSLGERLSAALAEKFSPDKLVDAYAALLLGASPAARGISQAA